MPAPGWRRGAGFTGNLARHTSKYTGRSILLGSEAPPWDLWGWAGLCHLGRMLSQTSHRPFPAEGMVRGHTSVLTGQDPSTGNYLRWVHSSGFLGLLQSWDGAVSPRAAVHTGTFLGQGQCRWTTAQPLLPIPCH